MKKLIFFIALLILFSCEKQDVNCWVCKIDSITQIEGKIVGTSTTYITPCGISAKDIFTYEEERTKTSVINRVQNGLYSFDNVIITTSTNCKKR